MAVRVFVTAWRKLKRAIGLMHAAVGRMELVLG